MNVICSMVITPNGYIARPDGSEDYASHDSWLDFLATAKRCNNFVIGRKTLEVVEREYDGFGFEDVQCDYKIVVSSQPNLKLAPIYHQATSPQDVIGQLESKVENVLLVGGSEINTAFAEAGLITDVWLKVEPHIIGRGLPLFAPQDFDLPLEYQSVEECPGGRLLISYKVRR